jgi:hypothetical protein
MDTCVGKPLVEPYLLDAVEKVCPNIDRNLFQTASETDLQALAELRKCCADNLPMDPIDINTWAQVYLHKAYIHEHMFFEDPGIAFVCSTLNPLFFPDNAKAHPVKVIAIHKNISGIELPVFHIHVEYFRLDIHLALDFKGWYVSVNSEVPLPTEVLYNLFKAMNVGDKTIKTYPTENLFAGIPYNGKQFVLRLNSEYEVYTLCFMLKKFMPN